MPFEHLAKFLLFARKHTSLVLLSNDQWNELDESI